MSACLGVGIDWEGHKNFWVIEYSICWQVYTLHRCMHMLKLIKLYTLYVVLYVNYISIKGVDKSSPSWCEEEIQRESIYDLDAGRCWRCLSPALFTVFSFSYPKNVQRGIWASQLWCPGDELREPQSLELPVCVEQEKATESCLMPFFVCPLALPKVGRGILGQS